MNTKSRGNLAENRAVNYLEKMNFKIVDRNFYSKFGEIDIIAFKNGVFHFVEVKSGKKFEPIYNITKIKLNRVIKTAYVYMKKNNINEAFCIDALIVKNDKIELIENISF